MLIVTKSSPTLMQDILAYFTPPTVTGEGVTVQPTNDTQSIAGSSSYLKELNRQAYIAAVTKHNNDQFSGFDRNLAMWIQTDHMQKEFSVACPAPSYWQFDNTGFDNWWNDAMANGWVFKYPTTFVTPVPALPPVMFIPDIVVMLPQPGIPIGDSIKDDPGYYKPAPGDVLGANTPYTYPDNSGPLSGHKFMKRLGPFDVASNGGGVWQDLTATGGQAN